MKTILVTGGTGFIGSHTCLNLIRSGYKVLILDSLVNSFVNVIDDIKRLSSKSVLNIEKKVFFFKCDLRDLNSVRSVFKEIYSFHKNVDAVIHFAGLKSVSESVSNPLIYWDVNFNGTRNLLEIMDKHNCKKFIFSSSATVYGIPKRIPILEEDEIRPINPYGCTKSAVEKLLMNLFESNSKDWKIISLRYFNPAGAHPSTLLGERSRKISENLFPIINQVAFGIREKLLIFGNDWPTHDGTCIRDYIHVEDLAEGHKAALNYLFRDVQKKFTIINLGNGKGFSVMEIIKAFENSCDLKIKTEIVDRRKGDVPELVANVNLAKKILNWEGKRDLNDICIDSWNFQKKLKKNI